VISELSPEDVEKRTSLNAKFASKSGRSNPKIQRADDIGSRLSLGALFFFVGAIESCASFD
jgi:hypothetical protein